MKLLTLTLRNFQGVRDFTLDCQGKNVSIFGDNGAGKTTLASAWNWLLFDKDSLNRKDFEIKTLTPDGEPVHGLEHEVEAVIDLDGERLTLRKVYTEKWTKTRGSAEAVFSGHTTKHYIDGVPVSKRAYDDKIADIVDENIFKLLTNPRHFNDYLKREERRGILLTVCGDVTDAEVINSDPGLKDLPEILGKRTTEQHRAVIKEQRAKVNRDLGEIKTRISEASHGLPDISLINPAVLESDLTEARRMLEAKHAERLRITQGGEIAEKQKALALVEAEMFRVEGIHRRDQEAATEESRYKLYAVRSARQELELDIKALEREWGDISKTREAIIEQMEALRKQWKQIDQQKFTYEQDSTCPTCGQAIPEEQLQEARDTAQEQFSLAKAAELEKISAEGKALKYKVDGLNDDCNDNYEKQEESYNILAELLAEEAQLQHEVDSKPPLPVEQNPEWTELDKQKQQLEAAIEALKESSQETIAVVNDEIETFRLAVQAYEEPRTSSRSTPRPTPESRN